MLFNLYKNFYFNINLFNINKYKNKNKNKYLINEKLYF